MAFLPFVESSGVPRKILLTLRTGSGDIWEDVSKTSLSVVCTIGHIVFHVARVDRYGSVVPYITFGHQVQPCWKRLLSVPCVRYGSYDLEMIVVLVPKADLICRLFNKLQPFSIDGAVMSYDSFTHCLPCRYR